ncbi:lipoprotein-releasing ABC transporter permease subunit [candidate division KSB1 bacterium]|nr:lipoprotein-releasing ABC transporter permease subunit [candidate division KSB1 bacterium]
MVRIPYELFIARRYLRSRQKTGFINAITYITVSGIAIGVAALIIVLSVMNGFESEVRERIIGFDTHVRLRTYHDQGLPDYKEITEMIKDIPHIVGISPYIYDKGMIRSGKYSDGIILKGSDPATLAQVSDLEKNIVYGEVNLGMIPREEGSDLPGLVVGTYLADRLYIALGDVVTIFSLSGIRSMFQMPPVKQFIVTGYFETGMFEFDNAYAYISIEAAQELFRMGDKVSGLEIRLDDLYKADVVVEEIDKRLGYPYTADTWFEMRRNLFSWMQLEKWAMFIVLCLIILVAAFNIITTLIMVVMEKTREIGILKSMGATSRSIQRIFLYEGIVVGVVGTLLGLIIGYALCWAQIRYEFFTLPGDVYFINTLPVRMQATDFLFIAGASILLCLVSAYYPAMRASRLIPVDAIRYE